MVIFWGGTTMTSAHFWEIFLPPSCQQFFFTLEMSAQFGDDVICESPLMEHLKGIALYNETL